MIFLYLLYSMTMESMHSLAEKENSVLFEDPQNLENLLKICAGFYGELADILLLKDKDRKIISKLTKLGNNYQEISNFNIKGNIKIKDKEDFDKCFKRIKSFFVELGKIFNDIIADAQKGKNEIVDGFVEEIFKLNDEFCRLNRNIKEQEDSAFYICSGINEYSDYNRFICKNYNDYNNISKKYKLDKENNKRLWINVYHPLLKLVNKELADLLGGIWEESGILSEEDFEIISKNLFIMDFLNIKSYKDYCNKYDIIKDKQKTLSKIEQEIDKMYDEKWNLKPGVNIESLHMKNLKRYLEVSFMDIISQRISAVMQRKD